MRAISLDEPWATLCCLTPSCTSCRNTRQMGIRYPGEYGGEMGAEYDVEPCDACPEPVKWIETRSWPAPPHLLGETIAMHATKAAPVEGFDIGGYTVHYNLLSDPLLHFPEPFVDVGEGDLHAVPLSPGHIVGTVMLADSIPMVDELPDIDRMQMLPERLPSVILVGRPLTLAIWADHTEDCDCGARHDHGWAWSLQDIEAQRPFGLYEAGRFGFLLENARSCWELCPACLGDEGKTCVWCMGKLRCPPIAARGFQRFWTWDPEVPS